MPDFDKEAHEYSPHYRKGFERAELLFQEILNSYESWDAALKENIFIILGDHGSDKLIDNDVELTIDLNTIYHDFTIARLTDANIEENDLAFANNHRMTFVYPFQENLSLSTLANKAIMEKRIALAAWLDREWAYVIAPESNELLRFKPDGPWSDHYGQSWEIEGDLTNVALQLDQSKKLIAYSDYPDVFNQLYSSLNSHDVPSLILTAKPGYTFNSEGAPVHEGGGEHGGLHKNDTLAAMIIAGTDIEPSNRRIVDLKDYILELLESEKIIKK